MIIVDDNSEDLTNKKLKSKFKSNKNIKYILRKKNPSLGLSIKEGIKKSNGNVIIVMDTDFNHSPKDLKKMINLYNQNDYDLICGSRFLKGGFSTTFFRHYCSKIFNLFVNLITGGNFSDNMSGFFIIKKSHLNKSIDKIFYGYGDFYIRLLFYMQKKKLNIHEIPVRYGSRRFGQSKTKFVRILILYSFETVKLVFKNI
tara:strand:+ start:2766 stop:3365 length:600 start_codon:yes stop_codon:yes gene_type:complete